MARLGTLSTPPALLARLATAARRELAPAEVDAQRRSFVRSCVDAGPETERLIEDMLGPRS